MLENAMITLHMCVCNRESKLKIVYLTLGISPCNLLESGFSLVRVCICVCNKFFWCECFVVAFITKSSDFCFCLCSTFLGLRWYSPGWRNHRIVLTLFHIWSNLLHFKYSQTFSSPIPFYSCWRFSHLFF